MKTATLPDVALMRVGSWKAETGEQEVTQADLESIVAASADHVIDKPYIKLGHDSDNAFNAVLGDGEPAYGWVQNVTVGDGSEKRPKPDTLYGDLVGMPGKLASIAPTAFRRRSIEIAWDLRSSAGKTYDAVLHAVSLLGVKKPAVKGLDDLVALYSEVETVTAFSAVLIDDEAAPVETGDTGSVPPGSGAPLEGEPVTSTAGPTSSREGKPMISKAQVDQALAQAGDDDVAGLLTQLLSETTTSTDTGAATSTTAEVTATGATAPQVVVVTAAGEDATATPETVVLTRSAFSELQSAAQAGAAEATRATAKRRDDLVVAAFSAGKITNDERAEWRAALDVNEESTTKLLNGLTARFSTSERGFDAAPDVTTGSFGEPDQAAWDSFADGLNIVG